MLYIPLHYELQTLDNEQNQTVDNIIQRILELEKALGSFQITSDNTNTDLKNKHVERMQLLHTIRQKKTVGEKI